MWKTSMHHFRKYTSNLIQRMAFSKEKTNEKSKAVIGDIETLALFQKETVSSMG